MLITQSVTVIKRQLLDDKQILRSLLRVVPVRIMKDLGINSQLVKDENHHRLVIIRHRLIIKMWLCNNRSKCELMNLYPSILALQDHQNILCFNLPHNTSGMSEYIFYFILMCEFSSLIFFTILLN